jgi:esterase/lipase/1-acyl-sn-glycerol-3-phosphate acyltransferase
MNHFAYRTTGLAIKTIAGLTRARLNIHGMENIPGGPTIFVVNHFTRIETFLLPYHLHRLTGTPVWALAAAELFVGKFGRYLEQLGAVSTPDAGPGPADGQNPAHRRGLLDRISRRPDGQKQKNNGKRAVHDLLRRRQAPPHTGAAALALRTEFYRQRIAELTRSNPKEAQRLADLFKLPAVDSISQRPTCIVPVNLTYYPLRAKDNALSRLAGYMVEDLPDRLTEEIITEGAMLLSGVDIDMRFGEPIEINGCLSCQTIQCDIRSASPIGFDDLIPSRKFMRREALKIMQRYMAAIYRLTTVNHDHLFASCLKKSPVKRIKKDNLKRRVYLASQRDAGSGSVHYHSSFEKDQVHLLTDDRYNKFSEFVDFAEEKKVVAANGPVLEKDAMLLSTVFDFHRSRIDNPIAVIANEVEPLTHLQRRISRLCWQPGFWLKRKIVRMLMKRALDDFDRDYDAFFSSDTSKARDVCRPFLIKGDRRRVGVVLAHGYMAAPEEVRGLATYLGKMGFWVYAPRLKGHGTAPEDLAACTYQDWIESMDAGYAIISNLCHRVIAGGFSTGAGLALDLAQRVPAVAGAFAVSTPLRLQDMAARFVPAVDMWNRFMARFNLDEAQKTFVDNHPENPHINYFKNPISGVRELERLMSSLEPRLPQITTPTLVVQSREDPVVNPKGTEKIFNLLGSTDKQLVLFNFQRHGILLGEGADRVYRTIGDFCDHIRKNARSPTLPVETLSEDGEREVED